MRKNQTIVKEENKDEIYTVFYRCSVCKYGTIMKEFKYCPECGREIIAYEVKRNDSDE